MRILKYYYLYRINNSMNFTTEIKRNRNTEEYNQDIVVLQDVSINDNNYGMLYYDVTSDILCFRSNNGSINPLFSGSRKKI